MLVITTYCQCKPVQSITQPPMLLADWEGSLGTCSGYKVSDQGVKSLWGNCSVFPRLGTQDTDRWPIKLPVSVSGAQSWKNTAIK